jgi:hypothetical protein
VTSFHHGFAGAKEDFDLVKLVDREDRSDDITPVKMEDMEQHMEML